MKTLYISDLDGTLLRSDQRTSDFTNNVINTLVSRGLTFSYATARSHYTACKVTEGMTAAFPTILYNGAFIRGKDGELLLKNFFKKGEADEIVGSLSQNGIFPIVYAFVEGKEKFSYIPALINNATADFVSTRESTREKDPRIRHAENIAQLCEGDVFYVTCIGDKEKLRPFYEKYRGNFHCVYTEDIYSHEQWLEIMPKAATKANAAVQLAELLGCDRIVAFGDAANDTELFKIADEAYAVENADPRLKELAAGVIGGNDDDGVAKWLRGKVMNTED